METLNNLAWILADTSIDAAEAFGHARRAAELAPEERDALSLAVSSDLSYREIAQITGTSEGNVKVRVHRARIKLRKMMNTGEK